MVELHDNMASSAMLPNEREKVVIISPCNGVGRILIREDTILNNIHGCAGCGRTQFACAGVKKKWSALCWGKQSDRKHYCLLVSLSAIFALSFIGAIFFCFTDIVNDTILSSMVIRNNSLAYSMWRRPTVHPLMKVHIFNYTNWQRVRDGLDKKLNVEDVGPYIYSQELERVNMKFDGDQLTFQERNHFVYRPELSAGHHYDQVNVPNLPLMALIAKGSQMPYFGQLALLGSIETFANHKNAFLQLPAQMFLWGYDDKIIDLIKPLLSFQGKLNFDRFGILVTKNGTVSDRMTINTGVNNMDKMNLFEKFNGEESLSYWGSPECNSIESTDGSIFPPSMLDKNRTLYVLYANLCRRLPFKYSHDVDIGDGIHLLRYTLPTNVFDKDNTENQCYCDVGTATCPPSGVINVTACAMGVPTLASFPHFHNADPRVWGKLTGLKPKRIQETFIDIHPTLGIALSGKSSIQINIQIKKSSVFNALSYLDEDQILPVAWIEMSVEKLPESLRSLVYHGTFSTAAAQLALTVFCILAFIVSSICLFVMLIRKKRKPCVVLKVAPIELETGSKSQM